MISRRLAPGVRVPQKIRYLSAVLIPLAFVCLTALARAAPAEPPPAFAKVEALYVQGDYHGAAQAGEELDTAAGLALGARALLAAATSSAPADQRLALIDRAEALARRAIAQDETFVEGHLQLVVALGHRAKAQGAVMAQIDGLAGETRRHIDRALELEPDNPWALAISGGWHLELVRRDPIGFVTLIYGARRSKGMEDFERALALDPTNIVLQVQYGLILLESRRRKYRDRAVEALSAVKPLTPPIAYDTAIKARGCHVLDLLEAVDRRALNTAVRNYNSLNMDDIVPPKPR